MKPRTYTDPRRSRDWRDRPQPAARPPLWAFALALAGIGISLLALGLAFNQ